MLRCSNESGYPLTHPWDESSYSSQRNQTKRVSVKTADGNKFNRARRILFVKSDNAVSVYYISWHLLCCDVLYCAIPYSCTPIVQ